MVWTILYILNVTKYQEMHVLIPGYYVVIKVRKKTIPLWETQHMHYWHYYLNYHTTYNPAGSSSTS